MEALLKKFYEWPKWEAIMHHLLFLIVLVALFCLYQKKSNRTLTNILLLAIVIALDTLLHQNINTRNNSRPSYL